MAKKKVCRRFGCAEPLYDGVLCRKHSDEADEKHRRYMEAAEVLHTGIIDGKYIFPGPLREEFQRLQEWWRQVCSASIAGQEHRVLKDETQYGEDWCIAIAQVIIDEERDLRAGKSDQTEIRAYQRKETWKRFENLERGLMSNGVARSTERLYKQKG